MTPDVNVLVAASRGDHAQHAPARDWLDEALTSAARGARFTMIPTVSVGVLRIVTNSRVFADPTPLPAALAFLRALLGTPGVEMAALGPEWPIVERLCKTHQLKGNDVTDAWIAAVVLDQHEHLVTFDRGFRRFLKAGDLTVLQP